MNHTRRIALATLVSVSALLSAAGAGGCNGSSGADADAGSPDKAALEAASKLLAQPVALIAAYQPYLRAPEGKDAYAPKRRNDLQKAGACAAGEIRFAATGVRQKLDSSAPATKEIGAALAEISKVCADAAEETAFATCNGAVLALDAAIVKATAAATAAGAAGKLPRVAPEAVTEEAKKAISPFLKALKPGPAELAYFTKRSDDKAAFNDVLSACQAASEEAAGMAKGFEHADEPLRLIAVTHKLSIDSQCHTLEATEPMRKDLSDCRKKAKSSECKVVCAKVRTRIEEGLPAAVFATLEADADTICGK
jgi:hypothetical protein